MADEKSYYSKFPRKVYDAPVTQYRHMAARVLYALRNADGTPYAAGHDDKSFGRIAYEAYVENGSHRDRAHSQTWDLLFRVEQDMWQKVAEAVLAANETVST